MEKQVIIAGDESSEQVDTKQPYVSPSLVELDLISTEGGQGTGNDGVTSASGPPV